MSGQPAVAESPHPHIERRADVQGGRPVIRGTRVPVSSLIERRQSGLTVEEILREFPQLEPAQAHDALSFYDDHRSEIDEEIAQNNDLDELMAEFPPTLVPAGR